jgi:hypothetical protein
MDFMFSPSKILADDYKGAMTTGFQGRSRWIKEHFRAKPEWKCGTTAGLRRVLHF